MVFRTLIVCYYYLHANKFNVFTFYLFWILGYRY